jgi:plasmid stabilization system protein ParE
MTAILLEEAEADLEHAFDYYEKQQRGLGRRLVDEFRYGVQRGSGKSERVAGDGCDFS